MECDLEVQLQCQNVGDEKKEKREKVRGRKKNESWLLLKDSKGNLREPAATTCSKTSPWRLAK